WGRWCSPLYPSGMQGISLQRTFPRKNAEEEVDEEDQLGAAQDKSCNTDKDIHGLLRNQEHILRRVVNSTHLPADADNVHRKEHAVNADESQPKMNLSERFIHEPAEHFREPEIQTAECRKQRSNCHHKMEVGDDEISILKLNIRRRGPEKNSAQSAAHKHRHDTDGTQTRRAKPDTAPPHRAR